MSGAICPIKDTIVFPEPSGKYLISLNTQIIAQMTHVDFCILDNLKELGKYMVWKGSMGMNGEKKEQQQELNYWAWGEGKMQHVAKKVRRASTRYIHSRVIWNIRTL